MSKKTIIPIGSLEILMSKVKLISVVDGIVSGNPVPAGFLFHDKPVLIFAIRRPGCIFCREQALLLMDIIKEQELAEKIQIIGIVKQVAPVPRAPTDSELGITDFQQRYFNNHPIFLDPNREFFKILGNRKVTQQPWSSWNPISLYRSYKMTMARVNNKNIAGNLVGEGMIQGGVIILLPRRGVKFVYYEVTGNELPRENIVEAIQSVLHSIDDHPYDDNDVEGKEIMPITSSPIKLLDCTDACDIYPPNNNI